jgi:hypothetical protein
MDRTAAQIKIFNSYSTICDETEMSGLLRFGNTENYMLHSREAQNYGKILLS